MTDEGVMEAELPLEGAGQRLLRAREAAGLTRAQIAEKTRIPERQLAAIEESNWAVLPARHYALGFARNYAKIVGLDPEEIASAVRIELAERGPSDQRRTIQTFEPGDPARVPGSRMVWIALAGVLAVLIGVFALARSMFSPGGELPSILPSEAPSAASSAAAPPPAAVPLSGPVVFTALEPKVWVKFSDAAGNQLLQKELAQGESWTVPQGQEGVTIWTARPDALAITIGGQGVPKLSDVQKTVKDVPVTAAALLARGTPAASPSAVPAASTSAPAPAQSRSTAQPRPRGPHQAAARADTAAVTQPSAAPVAAAPAPAAASPAPSAT
ncbi:MAG: helix-turn-helix domain-containing protein [Novosphingobium sp.]